MSTTVRINGGEAVWADFEATETRETVTTRDPMPDLSWSFVDAAGHRHAAQPLTRERVAYPTLSEHTRHRDCDGVHVAPFIEGEDCEGWDETFYTCPLCGEEVKPGMIPGPHTYTIEGPTTYAITAYGPAQPGEEVSFIVDSVGGERWSGRAVVMEVEHGSMRGWRSHLAVIGQPERVGGIEAE